MAETRDNSIPLTEVTENPWEIVFGLRFWCCDNGPDN
jgi:hypothetical protein